MLARKIFNTIDLISDDIYLLALGLLSIDYYYFPIKLSLVNQAKTTKYFTLINISYIFDVSTQVTYINRIVITLKVNSILHNISAYRQYGSVPMF